jgi:16S rRNA processing protein RimM
MKIHSHLEKAENFKNFKKFYIDGKEVDLELNFVKGNVAVVDIDGIRKRELAETYIGKQVFIDKSEMPELTGEEFYYADLVGLKVKNEGKVVGEIIAVENYGAGDLFDIEFIADDKPTKLYPFRKEIFPVVDVKGGFVEMIIPEEEFSDRN